MTSPEVCVLVTDGINCDEEMSYAFEVAGGNPDIVHVNQLRSGERRLGDFGILALPGGFSYGDDIKSGKVLANELTSYLGDQMREFTSRGKPILGVCNGFQVLVGTGLLPAGEPGQRPPITLTDNQTGRFVCRWIDLSVASSRCLYTDQDGFRELVVPMQVAHGEGRVFGKQADVQGLERNGQVVFQYATPKGPPANGAFPYNPNGSMHDIAGICDPTGTILGMMPHPERSITAFHPSRVRTAPARSAAQILFGNIVAHAREM